MDVEVTNTRDQNVLKFIAVFHLLISAGRSTLQFGLLTFLLILIGDLKKIP